jgi:hypothetical protein
MWRVRRRSERAEKPDEDAASGIDSAWDHTDNPRRGLRLGRGGPESWGAVPEDKRIAKKIGPEYLVLDQKAKPDSRCMIKRRPFQTGRPLEWAKKFGVAKTERPV